MRRNRNRHLACSPAALPCPAQPRPALYCTPTCLGSPNPFPSSHPQPALLQSRCPLSTSQARAHAWALPDPRAGHERLWHNTDRGRSFIVTDSKRSLSSAGQQCNAIRISNSDNKGVQGVRVEQSEGFSRHQTDRV